MLVVRQEISARQHDGGPFGTKLRLTDAQTGRFLGFEDLAKPARELTDPEFARVDTLQRRGDHLSTYRGVASESHPRASAVHRCSKRRNLAAEHIARAVI
jgi:hypothetical protein